MRAPGRSSKRDHGQRKHGDGTSAVSALSSPPSPPPRSVSPKLGNFGGIFQALVDKQPQDGGASDPGWNAALAAAVAPPSPAALSPKPVASCPDGGVSSVREFKIGHTPPRVSFLPRDFIDNLDLSKLGLSPITTKASSPVSAKTRSPSPAQQAYSTAASSPPSIGYTFDPPGERRNLGPCSDAEDLELLPGPGTPKHHAPVKKCGPVSQEPAEGLHSSHGFDGGHRGSLVAAPSTSPADHSPPCTIVFCDKLGPSALATLKQQLFIAELPLAADEQKRASIAARNYARLAQGAPHMDHRSHVKPVFLGPHQSLWFCPIPFGPLSRVVQIDMRDYQPTYSPLCTTNSVNPVYLASRYAKANIVAARLGMECAKDSVLQADHSAVSNDGIHVFVDMSNIIIGFYQHVKQRRGFPAHKKMFAPPFWFEGLSLILQRGRPVAKRVVAGSTAEPHEKGKWPDYMKDAEDLGYEMNILSRVSKPRPASPKPRWQTRRSKTNGSTSTGSSDEDPRAVAPPCILKNGEQCVDELLHLKMCESIIDFKRSTIVLATGDAAAAEFSGGFLAMAERALAKGWHVELVTWKSTISSSWQKLSDSGVWKEKFRIVPLDSFVEELFDSPVRSH